MRAGASTRCATHDVHANGRPNVVIRSGRTPARWVRYARARTARARARARALAARLPRYDRTRSVIWTDVKTAREPWVVVHGPGA
jgi:hypothetical protein